jgi:hypothetical protein
MPTPTAAGSPGWFTEGDTVTGTAPTILTADFLNLLQDELIAVLAAASIAPSKTTRNQVASAIQTMIAAAQGNGKPAVGITANMALTAAQFGSFLEASGAGGYTVTLPTFAGLSGFGFPFYNGSAGNVTFQAQAGQVINNPRGASANTLVLAAGTSGIFASDGASLTLISGSPPPPASTTVAGIAQLATQAEGAAGVNTGKIVTPAVAAQVAQSNALLFGAAAGSANAQTIALTPAPAALTAGMEVTVAIATTNTAAMSLNLNALGAKPVIYAGNPLIAGMWLAGLTVKVVYDGTSWQLQNPQFASLVSFGSNANGKYEIWSHGKIAQWGQVRGTFVEGGYTTTFPIPFLSAVDKLIPVALNNTGAYGTSQDYWAQRGTNTLVDFVTGINAPTSSTPSCQGFDWDATGQ